MEIVKIDKNNKKEAILKAIKVMGRGGIVLYPTDTVYGLGTNIFNKIAVRNIFEIKKRNSLKPLSVLVANPKAIKLVAKIKKRDFPYINKYLPGPYTLILEKSMLVPRVVTGGLKYVGVRVPDNDIACSIASLFPITTTSANLSNCETLDNPSDIISQLNYEPELVLDVGSIKNKSPSTIINLSNKDINIVER